jgi:alpha-tubulin suppressor-like RCC1 family protein
VAGAAGLRHSLVVREDGSVWAWGDNSRGQLGDGTVGGRRDTPAPVQRLTDVVAVAVGQYHSLALKKDGTVWAWGANQYSQLGDMTLEDQPLPVQVESLKPVAAIYASFDLSVALQQDGTVWTWGSDASVWDWGDLQPHPPAQAEGLENVVKVSMNSPGLMVLEADGTVWQWYLGSVWDQWPAYPLENLTDAVDLVWSSSTTQLLRADGTVWNLGSNTYGERGFPSDDLYAQELEQVPGLTGVVSLSAGLGTLHALRENGTLVGWGDNRYGTVGDGVSPLHLKPTRIHLPRP